MATIKELWFENVWRILEETRGLTKDQVSEAFLERAFEQGVSAAEAAAQVPLRGSPTPPPQVKGIEMFAPPVIPQPSLAIMKFAYWILTVAGYLVLTVGVLISLLSIGSGVSMMGRTAGLGLGGFPSAYILVPLWSVVANGISGILLLGGAQIMACAMNWWVKNRDTSNPR